MYLKYKFSSTSLFPSWELQLFKCLPCQRSVCANQLYISWTFWVEENFNIINQRGKPQKKGGCRTKFLKFSGRGEQQDFWLKFSGGKNLGGNYVLACNFNKKESMAQVFFCQFCEIFKNTFFTEHLLWLFLKLAVAPIKQLQWDIFWVKLKVVKAVQANDAQQFSIHAKGCNFHRRILNLARHLISGIL